MGPFDFSLIKNTFKKNERQNVQSSNNAQSSSDICLFSNDNNTVSQPTLTRKELKAQRKQEREEAKAERERIKNVPDGIIQGGRQGSNAGDCWLLAEMNSMAKTEWGQEAFKNAIKTNENGDFTVNFKGVNKEITITQKEFKKAQKSSDYSSSDADALLYELATERHFQETNLNNGTIKGNDLAGEDSLQFLLTGSKGRQTPNVEQMEPVLKAMGESPENNNGISATYVYNADSNDKKVGHAMSIQKVILDDNKNIDKVVVLDSYHPDSPQTMSYKRFKNDVMLFGYTTTPKNEQ